MNSKVWEQVLCVIDSQMCLYIEIILGIKKKYWWLGPTPEILT